MRYQVRLYGSRGSLINPIDGQATGDPNMARFRPRWPSIALAVAVLAGVILGFLGWWRSHGLAEEHASRAQRALDEMGRHYANIALCSEALKTARLSSDKARIVAIMKSSRRMVSKLEEAAARHECLARYYGYKTPFKRPESDSNP
jgi:hypothetical protein